MAALYIAGDDAAAKQTVTELARTLGFEPVDVAANHIQLIALC